MKKTVLLTGATDGIGLATAKLLASQGHDLLLHGRSAEKLQATEQAVSAEASGKVTCLQADFSDLADVERMANEAIEKVDHIDALINNAGVFRTKEPISKDGLDVRFVVNTLSPYRLTQRLLPILNSSSRVINLSSAAQAPVDLEGMAGRTRYSDEMNAYAQSKLAITMWSRGLARSLGDTGPVFIAVNPGSLLGSKMVKEGFGVAGGDIGVGAKILARLALENDFANASGQYFDNDVGSFSAPHADALDDQKVDALIKEMEVIIEPLLQKA